MTFDQRGLALPTAAAEALTRCCSRCGWVSNVEPEVHHIAVADDVRGALEPHAASVLGTLLAATSDEILVSDRFGANKAPFEIAVDLAGCLRRPGPSLDGPGVRFLRAGGEKGHQAEERIAGTNDAGQTGLLKTQRLQELGLPFSLAQLRQLGFDRRRDN